mmetsp:Transcript_21296/g.35663  ORF Transcript_21296/g.35663 Transcript_21296/m.35663 type:complete len:122 (-) Transcript_21296:265-630(-)
MSEESDISARGSQVASLLAKKDKKAALATCLQNPPVNAKSEELKEKNLEIVESVLSSISEPEIPGLLKELDLETCDVLMKYVYKIMGKSSNCAIMLKLHAQLVEKAGLGSIVRVMTERKQV